jgi:predicted nucleic acid-binding protein
MKTPSLDTSFAIKQYVQEPNSDVAREALRAFVPPLYLTDFLEMEIVTALHGKVFRKELSPLECDKCLANFHDDIAAGFWQRVTLGPISLRNRVISLASKLTPTLGARTLDLLHVAAALELGCTDFLSFDGRQRQVAQVEGLDVSP